MEAKLRKLLANLRCRLVVELNPNPFPDNLAGKTFLVEADFVVSV